MGPFEGRDLGWGDGNQMRTANSASQHHLMYCFGETYQEEHVIIGHHAEYRQHTFRLTIIEGLTTSRATPLPTRPGTR
jgi:hypothetical protein